MPDIKTKRKIWFEMGIGKNAIKVACPWKPGSNRQNNKKK